MNLRLIIPQHLHIMNPHLIMNQNLTMRNTLQHTMNQHLTTHLHLPTMNLRLIIPQHLHIMNPHLIMNQNLTMRNTMTHTTMSMESPVSPAKTPLAMQWPPIPNSVVILFPTDLECMQTQNQDARPTEFAMMVEMDPQEPALSA